MTVETTIGLGPVDAWLDPETREKIVTMGGRVLARKRLDDLEWERARRAGWQVRHGGQRRDDRRDDGDQDGPAR